MNKKKLQILEEQRFQDKSFYV
uniref:Uncharacterized protein n=1 Tax=Arundo donax TaxID=35708 RepID=A0A0A9F0N9_ARUDO